MSKPYREQRTKGRPKTNSIPKLFHTHPRILFTNPSVSLHPNNPKKCQHPAMPKGFNLIGADIIFFQLFKQAAILGYKTSGMLWTLH